MSITSMNARMGMAEKLSIQQLTKAVQDGTVPSFIGIPLIQQKMKEQQGAAAMQPKAPPVAQQVLQQAMATEGVQALPTNMPQEYAHGGILSYADGGDIYDDDEYDSEDYAQEYALSQGEDLMDEYYANRDEYQVDRSAGEMPSMYERKSAPGIESLREINVSPSGRSIEAKEEKVQVGDGTSERLLKHILHKESRGRRYDKEGNLLTSSKGAMGEMQVMPATARDPGFGITPARGNDPDELRRVGEEYAKVLLNRYRDPKLAAIAYNWGPGNTDKWLSAGADMSKLPQETRGYIQNMAQGGITNLAGGGAIKGFADGSLIEIPDTYRNRVSSVTNGSIKSEAEKLLAEARARAAQRAAERVATSSAAPASVGTGIAPAAASTSAAAPSLLRRGASFLGKRLGPLGLAATVAVPALDALMSTDTGTASSEQDPLTAMQGTAGQQDRSGGFKLFTPSSPSAPPPVVSPPRRTTNPNDPRLVSSPNFAAQTQNPAFNPAVTKPSPYDIEDMEAGQGADAAAAAAAALQQQAKKEEPTAATLKTPDYASGIGELLSKREAGLGKQRDIDNYMALLSAGLGMMGGTSPFAGANIGQGAQAGIKTFADSQARRVAEENAILSGRLGEYRYAGSRAQADALMQLRKDMAEKSDLRLREISAANRNEKIREFDVSQDVKASARLADIIKNIEVQAEKNITGDLRKNLAKDRDRLKQVEIERLTRTNKTLPNLYKRIYGPDADIFEGMTSAGDEMSKERASKFKVER